MAKTELILEIEGMHCAACVASVEKGIIEIDGVSDCRVNLITRSATIDVDRSNSILPTLLTKVDQLGYSAKPGKPDILKANIKEKKQARNHFLTALLLTIPLMVVSMSPMFIQTHLFGIKINTVVQAFLTAVILFYSGRHILNDAIKQSIRFHTNMNSLIALGTLTAFGWSLYASYKIFNNQSELLYFESAAMIITLILLGRYLEARSKGKASEAIQALMKIQPTKALAIINGVEIEIDAAVVKPDMVLLVRPGERIPADGVIIENEPEIDESMLTGESLPVDKKIDDHVFGGSLNGTIPFKMNVNATGEKTFLASIIRLVTDAQSKKADVQKLADRVAAVFVPIVLSIAIITFIVWYIYAPDSPMMIRSMISVLIIACPCALGLATPTAIMAGTGRAAKDGIIIRGGDVLEKITKITTVIFDKTGTLTHGELEVAEIKTFGSISDRSLISLVASIEVQSEHPVAKAIVLYLKENQIETQTVRNVVSFSGIGIKAEVDGRTVLIGNKTLMTNEKIHYGQAESFGEDEMDKGRTVVYTAVDGQVIGLIALGDRVRSEAKEVISTLQQSMDEIIMLSGDTRTTAGGVARSLGITNFEAEVRPDQKHAIVKSLTKSGYNIAMVGDGINDAPALAEANVGIAIGSGTDIAIESSDVILVRNHLDSLLRLFEICHKSLKVIKQNLFWAFFYNILALPIAAGIFYPTFGWSLSPIIAAAAMSFSSLFVVLNSVRLNKL